MNFVVFPAVLVSKAWNKERRESVCSPSSALYPLSPVSCPPERVCEQKHGFPVTLSIQRKLAKT